MAKDRPITSAAKAGSQKASPDLTNNCTISFYAAIWLVVAALVSHMFAHY